MPAIDHIDSMCARYRAGETLEQIGRSIGVTRERVRQLLKLHGVNSFEGGAAVRAVHLANRREEAKARRFFERYGMSRDQYRAINAGLSRPDMPITAYTTQLGNARLRGIAWNFTFATWWKVWDESGKWAQRGRGGDLYVMSRPGDEGPYSPENVAIKTLRENSIEQYEWNNFGGRPNYGRKDPAPEVVELLELAQRPGVVPSRACRNLGLSQGVWNNLRRGCCKTITPERGQALRREFIRMSMALYGPAPSRKAAA